ncbi:MAG TPA: DUF4412 domain-containing protein [bacterium]|nr:DUF4412 domain-containing protein [bacterium]
MKKAAVILAFLFAVSFFSVLQAFDFSSDVLMKNNGNTMKGKIFVSGERTRMEMAEMTVISRLDKKVAWILMNEQKMYMEQPVNRNMAVSEKFPDETERKLVGNDTVDGKKIKKYLVTIKTDRTTEQVYQWICVTTGMPLKTSAVDGSWSMELKNLKTGKQAAGLFEIPSGYTKMGAGGFMPAPR